MFHITNLNFRYERTWTKRQRFNTSGEQLVLDCSGLQFNQKFFQCTKKRYTRARGKILVNSSACIGKKRNVTFQHSVQKSDLASPPIYWASESAGQARLSRSYNLLSSGGYPPTSSLITGAGSASPTPSLQPMELTFGNYSRYRIWDT